MVCDECGNTPQWVCDKCGLTICNNCLEDNTQYSSMVTQGMCPYCVEKMKEVADG